MTLKATLTTLLCSSVLVGTAVLAVEQDLTGSECDRLAADPTDPNAVTSGVPFDDLKPDPALAACAQAIDQDPSVARYHYQYGRSLLRARDKEREAIFAFRQAVARSPNYLAASYGLSIAYDRLQEVAEATTYLQQAADGGYLPALLTLGLAYWHGNGLIEPDPDEARTIFVEAAERGMSGAKAALADLVLSGAVGPPDYVQVMQLYREAEDGGVVEAEFGIGRLYDQGLGVERNTAEAVRWFEQAADRKFAPAAARLADMLAEGEGIPQDIPAARQRYLALWNQHEYRGATGVPWLTRAAELGDPVAQRELAQLLARGDERREVEENVDEAVRWFQRAVEGGDPEAMSNLGNLFVRGRGVKRDVGKGLDLHREAAEAGYASANIDLGFAYMQGTSVRRDPSRAMEYFEKAAGAGNVRAMVTLGEYYSGQAFYPQLDEDDWDAAKAFYWAERAYAESPRYAAELLAELYYRGIGTPIDYERAAALAREAGAVGRDLLGELYARGLAEPIPEPDPYVTPVPRSYSEPAPDSSAIAAEASARPAPETATVVNVEVRAEPAALAQGEIVDLVLRFEIATGLEAEVLVRESRDLSFGGSRLPNFPLEDEERRQAGTQETRFSQTIPTAAQPGVYTFKGEVCVAADCISRTTTFEITP